MSSVLTSPVILPRSLVALRVGCHGNVHVEAESVRLHVAKAVAEVVPVTLLRDGGLFTAVTAASGMEGRKECHYYFPLCLSQATNRNK